MDDSFVGKVDGLLKRLKDDLEGDINKNGLDRILKYIFLSPFEYQKMFDNEIEEGKFREYMLETFLKVYEKLYRLSKEDKMAFVNTFYKIRKYLEVSKSKEDFRLMRRRYIDVLHKASSSKFIAGFVKILNKYIDKMLKNPMGPLVAESLLKFLKIAGGNTEKVEKILDRYLNILEKFRGIYERDIGMMYNIKFLIERDRIKDIEDVLDLLEISYRNPEKIREIFEVLKIIEDHPSLLKLITDGEVRDCMKSITGETEYPSNIFFPDLSF